MKQKNIFLVAYYYMKPQMRVKTQIKGWTKNENNFRYDEQVTITKALKNRDIETSKIILDLKNKKVVKNSWGNSKTFDELFKYYLDNYPQYTASIMTELDPDYLVKVSQPPEIKNELDTSTNVSST